MRVCTRVRKPSMAIGDSRNGVTKPEEAGGSERRCEPRLASLWTVEQVGRLWEPGRCEASLRAGTNLCDWLGHGRV